MQLRESEVELFLSRKRVLLREGDGYNEQTLIRKNGKIYENIPYYIASHCVSMDDISPVKIEHIYNLFVPEKEQLLIEIFKLNSIEPLLHLLYNCQYCGKETSIVVNIDELEFVSPPASLNRDTFSIRVNLPRSGLDAEIGYITVKQEKMLLDKTSIGETDLSYSDYLCLRSLGGKEPLYEDVRKLPLADHRIIRRKREEIVCGYDPNVIVTCAHCEKRETINIFTVRDFLFSV